MRLPGLRQVTDDSKDPSGSPWGTAIQRVSLVATCYKPAFACGSGRRGHTPSFVCKSKQTMMTSASGKFHVPEPADHADVLGHWWPKGRVGFLPCSWCNAREAEVPLTKRFNASGRRQQSKRPIGHVRAPSTITYACCCCAETNRTLPVSERLRETQNLQVPTLPLCWFCPFHIWQPHPLLTGSPL